MLTLNNTQKFSKQSRRKTINLTSSKMLETFNENIQKED